MINNKTLGLIGLATKAGKISFGSDSVEEDIKRGKVKLLIIVEDASERTKNKFVKISDEYKIPIILDGDIKEISKAIGKTNKAVIGVKDSGFAKAIQEKYNGGDIIG